LIVPDPIPEVIERLRESIRGEMYSFDGPLEVSAIVRVEDLERALAALEAEHEARVGMFEAGNNTVQGLMEKNRRADRLWRGSDG
jgi:hypothetical protein